MIRLVIDSTVFDDTLENCYGLIEFAIETRIGAIQLSWMYGDIDQIVVAMISNGNKLGLNFNDNSAGMLNV